MILRRIDGTRYSEVVPAWRAATVVVIGCGPSLTLGDIECVRRGRGAGVRCVVVNDAFLLAPWADVHYAADAKWHAWMTDGIDKPALGLNAHQVAELWAAFAGQKCSIEWAENNIADEAVHILRSVDPDVHGMGLSADPAKLATGRNSGAQAVNLAVLAGAAQILLLGFDGGPLRGVTHFHDGHPVRTPAEVWPYVRQSFCAIAKALPAGVEIVNCSLDSKIEPFPMMPIAEALEVVCA